MKRVAAMALFLILGAVSASSVLSSPTPTAEMVAVPAGSFEMGNSFGAAHPEELPVHTVNVSAFTIDKFEVTKSLWDEVATWAAANGYDIGPADGDSKAANHPVWSVSWYVAAKWANARSELEGLTPCYTVSGSVYRTGQNNPDCNWGANGYRLPTEAEWERAARGGATGHRFPWSDADTIQHARANYESSSSYTYDTSSTRGSHPDYDNGPMPYTSPVGSFAPNAYGLCDMAGNVWEWCWDWSDEGYYASSPGTDPRGPASGTQRVLRGGSCGSSADNLRVANRGWNLPAYEGSYLGLRLARTAPAPAEMALIPAGGFLMGDSLGDWNLAGESVSPELPVHTVYVSAFYMDRYEVTMALWNEVASWAVAHGYDLELAVLSYDRSQLVTDVAAKASDEPVYNVSWYEAAKWANARSEKEGLTPCYTFGGDVYRSGWEDDPSGESDPDCDWSANGYRLPTEAEWEKAARGGATGLRFPWSDVDTIDYERANYYGGGHSAYSYDTSPAGEYHHPDYYPNDYNVPEPYTSPVGDFAPNGYGLYDMAGNVDEWCWDWYDESYYASSPESDPHGPPSGPWEEDDPTFFMPFRVVRGGDWNGPAYYSRVASRMYVWPVDYGMTLGFRLVRSAP